MIVKTTKKIFLTKKNVKKIPIKNKQKPTKTTQKQKKNNKKKIIMYKW